MTPRDMSLAPVALAIVAMLLAVFAIVTGIGARSTTTIVLTCPSSHPFLDTRPGGLCHEQPPPAVNQ